MKFLDALVLADLLHEGQVDKAGAPYITHCRRVAQGVAGRDDVAVSIAALLHDTVEDGRATAADLLAVGVPARAVALVEILTKRPGVAYDAYLERVKADPDAVLIKRADLADNMNPDRLAKLPADMAAKLLRKYNNALEIINA